MKDEHGGKGRIRNNTGLPTLIICIDVECSKTILKLPCGNEVYNINIKCVKMSK